MYMHANQKLAKFYRNKKREIILIFVIFAICLVFNSFNNVFLSWDNIASILSNYAVFGIMGIGMMIVISTGNIDVSVGAQLAVISMTISILISIEVITNPFMTIFISLGIGLVLGLINGILVAILKLPAIIVTLGTMNIMRGLILLLAGSQWVSGLPKWFTAIARTVPLNLELKITAYAWVLACVLAYFFIYHTVLGRRVVAAGSNPEASIRIGSNPATAYIIAFTFMGLTNGLGALFYTANIGMAQPVAGVGYEMVLIAAVVIGGTSFAGGDISILGTFLGVLLLGIIENGMIISKIPVYWQETIRGLVIITAIVSSAVQLTRKTKIIPVADAQEGKQYEKGC